MRTRTYSLGLSTAAAETTLLASTPKSRLSLGTYFGGAKSGILHQVHDAHGHAELVYAESLSEKSVLRSLRKRSTCTLRYRYTVTSDNSSIPWTPKSGANLKIPPLFLGVYPNITLSLMPAKLHTIIELFGYKGDRELGLLVKRE
ncbi:hypothetical protein AX14_014453 [Amanita brunnescens Koide BX004]|nr:hypothetical protein AX14_014453 [Amanita brunnescens Koide BX004]